MPGKRTTVHTPSGKDTGWKVGVKKLRGAWAYVEWSTKTVWFDPACFTQLTRLELLGVIAHEAGHVALGLEQEHGMIDRTEHNAVAFAAALGVFTEDD